MSATTASIDTTPLGTGAAPAASRLRRLRSVRLGPFVLIAPAVGVVLVGAVGPLVVLALYSFGVLGDTAPAGLGQYREILGDSYYWDIYLSSLRLALAVTATALLIGLPLAFIISNSSGWPRTLLVSLVVMPLLVNIVVRNLGWVIVLSQNGLANKVLGYIGLNQSLPGTLQGIGLVLVHVGVPLVVLPVLTAIDRLEPAQREAARSLGAHPIVAFWRIVVPRVATGAVAGSTLVFLIAIGSLVTPIFLGQGKVTVVPTLIMQQISTFRWERTAALSMLLFVVVLAYCVVTQRVAGRLANGRPAWSRRRGRLLRARPLTAAGVTALNPLPAGERAQRVLRRFYIVLVSAFLLLPMVIVLKSAVDTAYSPQVGFDGFTLRWFREAFAEEGYRSELFFSLRLAVVSVLASLTVALAASWALVRHRFRGRDGIVALLMSPLLVPQAALAIGFVLFFLWLGTEPSFQRMLFAHVVISIPYMTRVLTSAFESVDERMEEAASSLGARPFKVFRRITLPLVRPGLFAAVLFGFLVSFDEAAISVLLASGSTTTFPIKLLAEMQFQPTSVGAAISALLIVALGVVIVPLERRFGIASNAVGGVSRK